MKEKYIGTLENLFGDKTYLYTCAYSIDEAKKNLEYQKSQKGELGMFKFMKVEKEIKDDTSKEEKIKEEEIQDKPELEELVEYDGYYVSNMGKVFMKKDKVFKQVRERKSQSGKVVITFNKDTYNLNSIIYRAFNQELELTPRTRIINIDGNVENNKLSNLKVSAEQENLSNLSKVELEFVKKLNKNQLIELIDKMCM